MLCTLYPFALGLPALPPLVFAFFCATLLSLLSILYNLLSFFVFFFFINEQLARSAIVPSFGLVVSWLFVEQILFLISITLLAASSVKKTLLGNGRPSG